MRNQSRLRAVENTLPPPKPPNEPGVVAASVYAGGKRIADIRIEEAGDWSRKADHVVWVGLPRLELLICSWKSPLNTSDL